MADETTGVGVLGGGNGGGGGGNEGGGGGGGPGGKGGWKDGKGGPGGGGGGGPGGGGGTCGVNEGATGKEEEVDEDALFPVIRMNCSMKLPSFEKTKFAPVDVLEASSFLGRIAGPSFRNLSIVAGFITLCVSL